MVMEKKTRAEGYLLVSNSANTVQTFDGSPKHRNLEGMSEIITVLFIVGETAGGGLIAMPTAMVAAGLYGGVLMILLGALMCAYTGSLLSENWNILQSRWPEYRTHCRKPYPSMGLRAMGPVMQTIVSGCLNVTMFGTAVVFLLLAAKNIENFLHLYGGVHIGFCYLILLVAIFMLPFTMLKSPKDFWWAVVGAMVTTSIAVGMLIYGSFLDADLCLRSAHYPDVYLSKFFMSFGTVAFSYGGHGAFPTIQHDMKKPYRFKRACWLAFLLIFLMYLPVSVTGYLVYGGSLRDSVIPSIQTPFLQQSVNFLITLHVILALTIIFNPLNQEWEELLKVPHEMGMRRVVARTSMMAFVVLAAETVPNFGVLLDLVGGSTITLMALVFPIVFNLFLRASKVKYTDTVATTDEKPITLLDVWKYTPTSRKIINFSILLFALIGGTAASASALNAMINSDFSAPCYMSAFSGDVAPLAEKSTGQFNCCGIGRNLSSFGSPEYYCLLESASGGGGAHG